MSDLYRFAAFISYSSVDKAFAHRLHRALETFRIPRQLGSFDLTGGGKPNRVYPVFRDREELPVGDLKTLLEAALRASNALIVICSPHAVASPWVDREIEYFQSLGRGNRIFPIIAPVSGAKASDDIRSFFPKTLLSLAEEGGLPLAADARKDKDGFRNAWLKLVAGQIGVNAGALRDRDESRRRSRAIAWSAASVATTGAVAGGLLAYVVPFTTYAKQYVRVFGEMAPVDAVSTADAQRRTVSYKFTQRGMLGPVIRVDRVNGQGVCSKESGNPLTSITGDEYSFTCNIARACSVAIDYAGSKAVKERTLDQYGNVLEELDYSQDAVQAIRQQAVVGCSRLDNGIKYINITRGETGADRGRDVVLEFNAEPGEPRANKASAYGYRMSYDSAGRPLGKTALGRDGKPALTSEGWATSTNQWSDKGDRTSVFLTGVSGEAVEGSSGWASTTFSNDAFGNTIAKAHFGADEAATADKDGVATYRYKVDDSGAYVSQAYLDAAGKPTLSSDGVASIRFTINEQGFYSERAFFGIDDKPVRQKDGCALLRTARDRYGDDLERSCHDADGSPSRFKEGYHRETRKWDNFGNIEEYRYFSVDGTPALGPRGVHVFQNEWGRDRIRRPQEFQKEVAIRAFGPKGVPARFSNGDSEGAHAILYDYDKRGFRIRERYVDEAGQPVRAKRGAFGYAEERDDRGNVTRLTPLGPEGEPVDIADVSYRLKRDEFGREVERTYVDIKGAPSTYKGVARFHRVLDANGRPVRFEYFGLDGARVPDDDGGAITEDTYDARGMLVRRAYRDVDGALTPGNFGAAIILWTRDARGHVTEYKYLGPDELPVVGKEGWSIQRATNDGYGNDLETRLFGTSGEPVLNKDGVHGWSKTYDARGNMLEFVYRGADWAPKAPADADGIAIYRYAYDVQNRKISQRYFDATQQPAATAEGVFGEAFTYNERGDEVSSTNLSADGKPGADKSGESRTERRFDARGYIVEQRYLDVEGALITTNRARSEHGRDRLGNETETSFFAANGDLQANAFSGRAVVRRTYDIAGRQLSEASFGADKAPVDRLDDGWHRKVFEYASGGALKGEVCFKVSGEETPCTR